MAAPSAYGCRGLLGRLTIYIGDYHPGAGAGQALRNRTPDSARRSGNHRASPV
jgi:hypothetical protein